MKVSNFGINKNDIKLKFKENKILRQKSFVQKNIF